MITEPFRGFFERMLQFQHYNMALLRSVLHVTSNFILIYIPFFILSSCFVLSNSATEIRRPRGVSISKASLYIPDENFSCFDGSNTVPFSQVNDDYCDCADGSDEPGTSACPMATFHCTNAGHRPLNIPSSLVNDGICDCCDGADEYIGKITCTNNCHELGKAERMEAQKQAEIAKLGYEAKLHSIKKGKQLKLEKQEKLKQLEIDKQEAENIRAEREKFKLEVEELEKIALEQYRKEKELEEQRLKEEAKKNEEQEAFEIFNLLDSNQDKKIQLSELQVRQTFDQNKDGVVSDEEAQFFMDNNEELDWGLFVVSAWPKMKPFFLLEKGLFKPPERNFTETAEPKLEPGDGVGTVEDVTAEYQKERQKVEEVVEADGHEGEEEEEEEEEEEDSEANRESEPKEPELPQYDEETQKLVNDANDARSQYEEADRTVRDIQRQITQYQEYLEKDYGPEEEFAPLEGECFEFTDTDYVYKLCPFDQASQQPRSGEAETRLGQWSKWAGPDNDKYQVMLYDKGQSCWNGPQRSTTVKLKCGVENVITSVTEPNRCEYLFEFSTPSACKLMEVQEEKLHDEL